MSIAIILIKNNFRRSAVLLRRMIRPPARMTAQGFACRRAGLASIRTGFHRTPHAVSPFAQTTEPTALCPAFSRSARHPAGCLAPPAGQLAPSLSDSSSPPCPTARPPPAGKLSAKRKTPDAEAGAGLPVRVRRGWFAEASGRVHLCELAVAGSPRRRGGKTEQKKKRHNRFRKRSFERLSAPRGSPPAAAVGTRRRGRDTPPSSPRSRGAYTPPRSRRGPPARRPEKTAETPKQADGSLRHGIVSLFSDRQPLFGPRESLRFFVRHSLRAVF